MHNEIIALNPDRIAPLDIVQHIVSLEVPYVDFSGQHKTGSIEVHAALATEVHQFFVLALVKKFPIEKVVKSSDAAYKWDDDALLADNASSGFNYRFIKDTDQPSLHGQGMAVDINTRLNPYIRYIDGNEVIDPPGAVYEPGAPGVFVAGDPLVTFMKNHGWTWGGDWSKESGRIDYQHFEKNLH